MYSLYFANHVLEEEEEVSFTPKGDTVLVETKTYEHDSDRTVVIPQNLPVAEARAKYKTLLVRGYSKQYQSLGYGL